MITHTIKAHDAPRETAKQRSRRYTGEIGSDPHRIFIFERTLKDCKFKEGDWVTFKGEKWQVLEVHREFDDTIKWDGLSANIMGLWREDRGWVQVHPNRVKRAR